MGGRAESRGRDGDWEGVLAGDGEFWSVEAET